VTQPVRWTAATDVRAHVERLWRQGVLLASAADLGGGDEGDDEGDAAGRFPLRVPLRGPSSAELGERFAEAREWITGLRSIPRVRLECKQVRHRQLGTNEVPSQLWVDTVDDAAALIGRTKDLARFRGLVGATAAQCPAALGYVTRRPLDALAAAPDWPELLAVAQWIADHPEPGRYVRQLDLPGVHTKLVETNARVIAGLVDELAPDRAAFAASARSANDVTRRYGFRRRPRMVRFRSLDPAWRLTSFDLDGDYSLTTADFARIPVPEVVFVTENEVNFLAFPPAPGAIVVFGAGSGVDHLAEVRWLATRPVFYWGDIDTHGYWILDQFRAAVPHASSMLMDRATLVDHERYWGDEPKQFTRDLTRLDPTEREVYDDLRDNRLRANLRLEQERVRFGLVRRAVAGALAPGRRPAEG
jgi:hypothetical protein